MHMTLTHPQVNVGAPRQSANVCTEKHVREKKNLLVRRNRIHHFDGVAGGAAIVAFGFHFGRRVHIRDDDRARMLRFPCAQLIRIDRAGERTTSGKIGEQHRFFRRQDRGRFGHEVHAAKHDHIGVGACGFTRKAE